ncbi:hypothetical protein K488DRAFT_79309 [Vararia minispora EC-137]|uniref:Uncharacterized protein n=1 Tax=Vararia minispora EC-137 TaxID=1314806 RepID=A0ACB8QGT2_9AGAM|nr:hypothetical protein K488DRAFT_79309 [Vararia minispora EC-137]
MVFEVRLSSSRNLPYFYNTETQSSSWDAPKGLTPEQILALPGAELLSGSGSGRPAQVRASHLLVKHNGSRRPSSWREAKITRSKEEAIEILKGYSQQIGGDPTKFAELARQYSDCSSASNGGDLGKFGPGQMQKAFEDATYALKVNQMSGVISTDSGVHIILRTA